MKTALAVALVLALSGCGWGDRVIAHVVNSAEICVDGVAYLQFASGASVKYTPDGKVATCK
jgi:hypothetical protein